MSRNSSGIYTLPSAQFVAQTTISSSAVNSDLSDIATTLTGTLATTGVSVMTAAFVAAAGSVSAPSYTINGSLKTGWFKVSTGVFGFSANGTEIFEAQAAALAITGTGANLIDRNAGNIFAIPVGTITDYAVAVAPWTAPKGWLYCYGQTVLRSTYAALFAVIGGAYGSGDGSSTFGIPDLRGNIIAGLDNMGGTAASRLTNAATNGINGNTLANTGGLQTNTLTQANMPSGNASHTLGLSLANNTNVWDYSSAASLSATGATTTHASQFGTVPSNAVTFGGSVTSGGSGTAGNVCQPTIIVAKMIYTGV